MLSDWFNGIEILQGRWQHGEKVGYCYPVGLEKARCKWDIYVPLVTKALNFFTCVGSSMSGGLRLVLYLKFKLRYGTSGNEQNILIEFRQNQSNIPWTRVRIYFDHCYWLYVYIKSD